VDTYQLKSSNAKLLSRKKGPRTSWWGARQEVILVTPKNREALRPFAKVEHKKFGFRNSKKNQGRVRATRHCAQSVGLIRAFAGRPLGSRKQIGKKIGQFR